MSTLTKAAVQGATFGLLMGAVLLVGGRVWRPATVEAQAKQAGVPEVVRAQRFEVVDRQGKAQATFDAYLGGPMLSLLDWGGKKRVSLGLIPNGSAMLTLRDGGERIRASLEMRSDGSPTLVLCDDAGRVRAALGTVPLEVLKTGEERRRPESSLVLFDKDAKVIWQAP